MKKTYNLTCQNCGARLDVKDNIAFCSCCGSKLVIDDDNSTTTYNHNYTYIRRDEASIRESERKEKIRLQELENEESQNNREHQKQKWSWIGWAIVIVVFFGVLFFTFQTEKPKDGEIKIPASMSDYKGEQYEIVVQELEDLGFYNIETAKKKDLVTGWITKDGEVYKVSINGDSDFDKGDIFPEDATVVVTYHAFKD